MSQSKKFIMTYEGVKKLEEELEYLKTVKRKEITEKIKVALGYGDLSENSEYDEAKNDQAFTEGRIIQLENMLKNAVVVDESEIPKDKVSVGSIVKVMDYEFDEEVEYTIVGSAEADPMNFKISNESPVGSALIGKKVGDVVEVAVPSGVSKFEVLEIRRD
ncbi:MAG: transcription elongation factor GreA [Clostridium celatum]|jgi:transcription elongation factor GreA|uniref:Transcription elongation factor GreA n=1 Tax=Clostridium saudiense TaxID=1414720 RepID=A0ABS2FGZ7_9CLOT|nr:MULTISPECIES: transcription elongation factor GreA [Clostridiaceae]MBS6184285.1 transcription elongation factor GreA [Clostridium celatum]MBM6819838.1 transcription elongation factor GreA [Clostridium saudiense]MBS4958666.1 transcription elongation factor GreA [Clostridium sp.]MDO5780537.1 transcription elongation factor GreA [Clostridium sp.]MDU2124050.1 transcription elongation factor GreA [Clostridium celatum]